MFSQVRIENFRGIKSLRIDGLARLNVFIGENGCGKTSLLESLMILGNRAAPQLLLTLAAWRDQPMASPQFDVPLRCFFFNLDPRVQISLGATGEHGDRGLEISAIFGDYGTSPAVGGQDEQKTGSSFEPGPPATTGEDRIGGVLYNILPRTSGGNMRAILTPQGLQPQPPFLVASGDPGAFYVHARRATSLNETANVLTDLAQERREEMLYKLLRTVNPKVRALWAGVRGGQTVVLADLGEQLRRMPIQLLGDGFCRICLIATGLAGRNAKMAIVDEIDSGLHYSTMPGFWQGVAAMCIQCKVQLFCSTHNEEMLRALVGAFPEGTNDVAVFRLDRQVDGGVKPTRYDVEMLRSAEKIGLEVR